jgi:hypothetical protein
VEHRREHKIAVAAGRRLAVLVENCTELVLYTKVVLPGE